MANSPSSKFDNWEYVDCNNCANYYSDACDGLPMASERPCNSFKAIRGVDIPAQIGTLRVALKWLTGAIILLGISQILLCINIILK